MPKARRPRGGPYDDAVIGRRIAKFRESRGITVTDLCAAMNAPDPAFTGTAAWDKAAYWRKTRGVTALWPAEVGKLAKVLGMPRGFPWIGEEDAMLLESVKKAKPARRPSNLARGSRR